MSKILNLVVSRHSGMALAGTVFVATNAQAGPYSLASADPPSQTEQPVAPQPATTNASTEAPQTAAAEARTL